MPNPRLGTVTMDVKGAVTAAKGGQVEFRAEKAGIVHAPIGKANFEVAKLTANVNALLEVIMKAKPSTAKGVYLRGVTVSTTMGPGIKLDTAAILALHK
jgi:large subunit ribosomal protein L1